MSLTLGRGLAGRVLGAAYTPAVRSLTSWYKPNFTASPWLPTASAGSSGANGNLAEATNPPAQSAALNGLTGANFDGTNDELSNATAMSTLLSDAAGSIVVMFHADTAAADSGATGYYFSPCLFSDDTNAFLALTFDAGGVRLGCYNGVDFNAVEDACSTGTPHIVMARWNATDIEIRVDSGSWVTMARAVVMSGSDGNCMGRNGGASAFFDGKIYERMTEAARWSDGTADDIKGYLNAKFGTAL